MRLGLLVTIDVEFEEPHINEATIRAALDQRTAATLYLPRTGERPKEYPEAVARRISLDVQRLVRRMGAMGAYTINGSWLRMKPKPILRSDGSLEIIRTGPVDNRRPTQGGGAVLKGFVVLSENYNKEKYGSVERERMVLGRKPGELFFVATAAQGRRPYESQTEAEGVATELLRTDENATFYVAELVSSVQTETAPVKKTDLRAATTKGDI